MLNRLNFFPLIFFFSFCAGKQNSTLFPNYIWSRNLKNRKLNDYGQLPLEVPEIVIYLADSTHWEKSAAEALFKHANSPKRTVNSQSLRKMDCECIQVNIGHF